MSRKNLEKPRKYHFARILSASLFMSMPIAASASPPESDQTFNCTTFEGEGLVKEFSIETYANEKYGWFEVSAEMYATPREDNRPVRVRRRVEFSDTHVKIWNNRLRRPLYILIDRTTLNFESLIYSAGEGEVRGSGVCAIVVTD